MPEDARLKKLVLTQKGEEVYQAVRSNINDRKESWLRACPRRRSRAFLACWTGSGRTWRHSRFVHGTEKSEQREKTK